MLENVKNKPLPWRGMKMEMSRDQCRAARALLKMSQKRLADAAGISLATVMNFELGTRRNVTAENIQAMRVQLELAGVMFDGNGGVKLRRRK